LTAALCAQFLGTQTGPNPTDRAKLGRKRHLVCDGGGVPLVLQLTGANRNDSKQALLLFDAIRRYKDNVAARDLVLIAYWEIVVMTPSLYGEACGLEGSPYLAKRNTDHSSGLGRWRRVVERILLG